MKKTEFRVLWVRGDAHDEAPRLSNKTRMSEAEALTQLDSQRLQKKKMDKKDDANVDEMVDGMEEVEIISIFD
jgi:hypothetical protein